VEVAVAGGHELSHEHGEAGLFHKIPRIDDSWLAQIFAREVLGFLVRMELLSPDGQSGFSPGGSMILSHLQLTFIADRPPPPHITYQRGSEGG
jgi:hypothetical protein